MHGILGEPVEVWLRDGTPARFVWRGRRYTVMFVLDRHFVPAMPPVSQDAPPSSADAPAAELAVGTGAGSDCWRVEATPERTLPPVTYELCHDLAADRWSLSRG
jgi:Family of unknown function (DUF6504)